MRVRGVEYDGKVHGSGRCQILYLAGIGFTARGSFTYIWYIYPVSDCSINLSA